MLDSDVTDKNQAIAQLMGKHLGTRGKNLEGALRRAGRRLPKRLRAKAFVLIEAQHMSEHPKLARRIDHAAVSAAYTELEAHLSKIDLAEQRKTKTLNIVAGLVLNLLIFGAAVLAMLRWRGII